MSVVRLDDIISGDPDVDEAFVAWRRAIEAALNLKVTGHCTFHASPDGMALHVKRSTRGCIPAKTTSSITARSGTQLGTGTATLYNVSDTGGLTTGDTVTIWNNASGTAGVIATATEIFVTEGDSKWYVHWEQCPP